MARMVVRVVVRMVARMVARMVVCMVVRMIIYVWSIVHHQYHPPVPRAASASCLCKEVAM